MKPFRIVLGIAVIAVVTVVGLGIRSKIDYDKDEREIKRLLADIKALGVPTNGTDLVQKIPNQDNAWLEIEPYMTKHTGRSYGNVFKSTLPMNIVTTTGPHDIGTLRSYLAKNTEVRDKIEGFLNAKPDMQVAHDYNEGFAMLLPEFAAIRPLAREYCYAAYADALEGNWDAAKRHLDLANRFATMCLGRCEIISEVVGASIRKTIYQTGYRIMELRPEFRTQVEEYLGSPELNTVADEQQLIETEFVAELTIGRNFDIPEIDRPVYPAPLDKLFRTADESKIQKLTLVNGGDYMPSSYLLRKYLIARLRSWKPFLTEMKQSGMPSTEQYDKIGDMFLALPKSLSFLSAMAGSEEHQIYHGIALSRQYSDINKALLKAVHLRTQMAEYPRSLDSLGLSIYTLIPIEKPVYEASEKGVLIRVREAKPGNSDSVPTLSYPVSLSVSAKIP